MLCGLFKKKEVIMDFNKIIEKVLKHEGGYVNDPTDLGGETNYGITKRFYPDVDIKNLTEEQAKEIYKKEKNLLIFFINRFLFLQYM